MSIFCFVSDFISISLTELWTEISPNGVMGTIGTLELLEPGAPRYTNILSPRENHTKPMVEFEIATRE